MDNNNTSTQLALIDDDEQYNGKLDYKVMEVDGKTVFLHEAVWALHHGRPIPDGNLVYHLDADTLNNDIKNLALACYNEEKSVYKDKVFHVSNFRNNKALIEEHFSDVHGVLFTADDGLTKTIKTDAAESVQ